jgi:hypothetical protein
MTKKKAVEKVDTKTNAAGIDEAVKLVGEAVAALGAQGPGMTTIERQRSVKIRTGDEKYIPLLVALAVKYAITSPVHAVAEMADLLVEVQKLVPLQRQVEGLLKLIEDSVIATNGDMWSATTFVYAVLKRMAKRDGSIALAIEPLAELFAPPAKGKTTGKATAKGGITTTSSTTPATVQAQPAPDAAAVVTTPHT